MAYGVLIVLVPPEDSWPAGESDDARIETWRERLTVWEHDIQHQAAALGARSVLSFIPLHVSAVAQTNVWLDNVGETLEEAMQKATELALGISYSGHVIRSVQVLDWTQNPMGTTPSAT